MDLSIMKKLMETFMATPIDGLTYRRAERLYTVLLSFQIEHEDDYDEEFNLLLENTLEALHTFLLRKNRKLANLKQRLINDPCAVEMVLSKLNLLEILQVEQHGLNLHSPELRRQFDNMITRRLEDLCLKDTFSAKAN